MPHASAEIIALTADDVRRLVPVGELIEDLRRVLAPESLKEFEVPPRHIFSQTAGMVMPCHDNASGVTVTKCLSQNPDRQPAITGTAVWNSPSTPDVLVADAIAVTTLRTGAVVGLATDLLAPAGPADVVLFGAGAQSPDQIRSVAAVREIARLTIVARRLEAADALADLLRAELPGTEVRTTNDGAPALRDATVVCCATRSTVPLFSLADLAPGHVHVNAIGAYLPTMHELPEDLLAAAEVIAVDDVAGCLHESGELIDAIASGAITADRIVPVGSVTRQDAPRSGPTVFKSVGTAILDWVVMDRVAKARALAP
jgi:ornithine cyclodeaminase/alanine dehydrogenase-like protein (mu-crystallin family)